MKILAFETSAKAASVALLTDGRLTGEYFQNSGQTHSRTVMKLAKDLLDNCDLSPADLDLVAWANGPGSFTGVRIGVAAAKGLCWGLELPCVPVSTLEAMAWSAAVQDGIVCCCMDARRSQVYNAVFEVRDGKPVRIREDRAISIEELAEDLAAFSGPILLTGDGAALVYDTLRVGRADQIDSKANIDAPPHPSSGLRETPDAAFPSRGRLLRTAECRPYKLLPEHRRQQRASGVALAAWEAAMLGKAGDPALSVPNYLRLSQAERERLAKDKSLETNNEINNSKGD